MARDRLVTGEAVVVELPAAGVGLRLLSGVIDVVAAILLLWGGTRLLRPVFGTLDSAAGAAVALLLSVVCFVGLPTTCEALWSRTLGKAIVGLRTVRDDGGPIDLRRALARHLVGYVEVFATAGCPAFVTAVLTTPTRRLGDITAGTFVARNRVPMPQRHAPPVAPDPLATWAASADLSALPDLHLLRVRSALVQRAGLTPGARHDIARRLLDPLLPQLVPPPPVADPETVLVAILAERRKRDVLRLEREERLRERLFPASAQSGQTAALTAQARASRPT